MLFKKVSPPDLPLCPDFPLKCTYNLQAILTIRVHQVPPKGRRLLVVATSSQRAVLDQMEMIPCFTDVLHVPNLSTAEHLLAVIRESKVSRPTIGSRWKRGPE